MKETEAEEVTPQEALRILSWERCQYGKHHQTEPGTIEELREKREKAQAALDTARSVYLRYRDAYQQAVDEFDRLDVSVYRALERDAENTRQSAQEGRTDEEGSGAE